MFKTGIIALGLLIAGSAGAASKLGEQQKAAVIRQLNKRVEKGNWRVRLSGSLRAKTRSFTASDIHRRTKPPFLTVGHMIKGKLDTKTKRISIGPDISPK